MLFFFCLFFFFKWENCLESDSVAVGSGKSCDCPCWDYVDVDWFPAGRPNLGSRICLYSAAGLQRPSQTAMEARWEP